MAKSTVVYWNNIPSPYFVERLNAVADRGNLDVEAWFCERLEPDRSWAVDESNFRFRYRYLRGGPVSLPGLGRYHLNAPLRLLGRSRPDLLVSLYAEPTFLLGWWLARTAGIRTAFRVLPTYDAWVHRTSTKERVKRWALSRVDGVKVPGPDGAAFATRYGVPPDRIHLVRQSVDVQHWEHGHTRWLPERDRIRHDFHLSGCVFMYVGRLWRGKGLDDLLEAYGALGGLGVETNLLLVGDGKDEARYRQMVHERGLRGVVFAGFVQHDELARLYAAADVLVFPTLGDPNGLVVEEAMASHLPVISSDAAGDIRARLPEGVAGHVVPTRDPGLLGDRMAGLAKDPQRRARMGEAAASLVAAKSHEAYAQDFERFVERVLAMPRVGEEMATQTAAGRRRPHVIYWSNIPAPYMVERFNAVARRGNIDLEAWFGARTEPNRSWTVDEPTWEFPHRYLPRVGIGSRRLSLPSSVLSARRPDLLVSLYATPSFLAGLRLAWWRGWRTALWVEVTFDSWVRRRRWKEVLKRAVFRRVDGIITAGQDGRAFAMQYGVPSERIQIARHVVDAGYFAAESAACRPERDRIRAELGVSGVVFIYVGRLWWGKGTRPLLAAYASVARDFPDDTSLLLIGDGPEGAPIARACEIDGLRVKLAGFRQRAELCRMYAAGDVFVFPTLGDPYGLVVDEAMAAGLPVISTTAAGEIRERVIDDVNGYLIPPDDPAALAAAMRRLAADPALRSRMGARSAELIASYTPDRWAEAFEKAVQAILSSSRKGSPS